MVKPEVLLAGICDENRFSCSIYWGKDNRNISMRCCDEIDDLDGAELQAYIHLLEDFGANKDCKDVPMSITFNFTRQNVILWLSVLLPSYKLFGWQSDDSYPEQYGAMLRYAAALRDNIALRRRHFTPRFCLVPADSDSVALAQVLAMTLSHDGRVKRISWDELTFRARISVLAVTPGTANSPGKDKAVQDMLAAQARAQQRAEGEHRDHPVGQNLPHGKRARHRQQDEEAEEANESSTVPAAEASTSREKRRRMLPTPATLSSSRNSSSRRMKKVT